MLPIAAYADRLSARPGETLEFKVSSEGARPYRARVVRVVCGDPNPDGPGIVERPIASAIEGEYPGRFQPVALGSYGVVADASPLRSLGSFTVFASIWPTTPDKGEQYVVERHDPRTGAGFALLVDADGSIAFEVRDREGGTARVRARTTMRARAWYRVWGTHDAARGRIPR